MEKKKDPEGNRVLLLGALWGITYIACFLVVKELKPDKAIGIALSILPAAMFAVFIYKLIKAVGGMDELERRIQLEATVIGFALGLLMIMTLGLLDLTIVLKKEDWGYRHLVPYFVLFYLVGIIIAKRKYT
jgi:hypothetical protein